ncbi:MAG: hypothetical protein ACM30E_04790 [Nitrososphaerales archaeon]
MAANVVVSGWDRPVPGREGKAIELFQEYMQYLGGLQQAGTIQSFEAVLLDLHGGDLNGFTMIRGDPAKLDALLSSDEWATFMTRAGLLLEGFGQIRGVSGDLLAKQMGLYAKYAAA